MCERRAINVCATRRPVRSGRGFKGSRHQSLVPAASWGLQRGGRCLHGCYGNRYHSEALCTESLGGVRGTERTGEKKKEEEGGVKKLKKSRRTTATRTEPNAETNVPGEPPNEANKGANEVETSRGLGLASLNINFCQQT